MQNEKCRMQNAKCKIASDGDEGVRLYPPHRGVSVGIRLAVSVMFFIQTKNSTA